jgi:hydrogenase nickel incorporation protein HypB
VEVFEKILAANDRQADENRKHFEDCGITAVNLMSSPGSGKTALIEKTLDLIGTDCRIGVIEGDLETDRDAERIRAKGAPAYQISTGQACHIDACMVHEGLHHLPLDRLDLVFIENVGNLVCPASYDTGGHYDVVLLSVTEGDDKPAKYPVMFRKADLLVISKIDLLPHLDFDVAKASAEARNLNPQMEIISLSAKTGEGLDSWLNFLARRRRPAKV